MLRSRFLWKLFAGYALLVVLTAVVVGWLVAPRVEQDARRATGERLAAASTLLAEIVALPLELGEHRGLAETIDRLASELGVRVTVIDLDGRVAADSHQDPARMDDHGGRPEILEARARGTGTSSRPSTTLGQPMLYVARAVRRGGELRGYVRTAMSLRDVESRLAQLRRAVVAGIGVGVAVALFLGLILTRRFTRPLVSLTTAAEAIARGESAGRVPVRSQDELGTLGRAFNAMTRRLEESLSSLSADRNKLSAILASMVEGVVAVDRDERVLHLNGVAARLLEISAAEASGKAIWELTRRHEIAEVLRLAMRREAPVHRVLAGVARGERTLELHAAPLRAGGGVIGGAVVVLDDVTELERLETVRRDFVANVSHELKTPLTVVQGLLEMLLDDDAVDPATQRRFLEKAKVQAERLSTLVNDLLVLSRLESDSGSLELEGIDLREPVLASIRALQPVAEARRVVVETDLPSEPVRMQADDEALQEAVLNLLDNAVKYSSEGGVVTVRLRVHGSAVIEVEDRGIGIEPRHQERIFERFYRIDRARSRQLGGTGLGLSIVRHVAIAHGGAVSVDSRPGGGSTFRIHLFLMGHAGEEGAEDGSEATPGVPLGGAAAPCDAPGEARNGRAVEALRKP